MPCPQIYDFAISAENKLGEASSTEVSNTVIVGAPEAPDIVTAITNNEQVQVLWTAPAANAAPISSYTVTTSPPDAAPVVVPFQSGAVNQTQLITGLTNFVGYVWCAVVAFAHHPQRRGCVVSATPSR